MASARKVTRAAIFILCACENIFITVTMVVINNKIRVGQVFKLCLELCFYLALLASTSMPRPATASEKKEQRRKEGKKKYPQRVLT